MAANRPFGATNQPGTCLWCGKKLRWKGTCTKERVPWPTPALSPCCRAQLYAGNSGTPADGIASSAWCEACEKNHDPKMRIVSRERWYDKPGDYGDGHFCGLRCGHAFGCALADNGRRPEPIR